LALDQVRTRDPLPLGRSRSPRHRVAALRHVRTNQDHEGPACHQVRDPFRRHRVGGQRGGECGQEAKVDAKRVRIRRPWATAPLGDGVRGSLVIEPASL
jgi:hypothetical protein